MAGSRPFQQQVAIVTGASTGIGAAIAEALASAGAHVALAARSYDKLEHTAARCRQHGVQALSVPTDVSDQTQCQQLVDQTVKHFQQLDILINNAGISMRALFEEMDLSVMEQTMQINFWGTVYCTHAAMPYLLSSQGWIVGVSSIAGFRGLPARTAYSASKFAMNGFLEALRTENQKTGLRVLTLCPGFTASNIRAAALDANGRPQGSSPRSEGAMMQPETVAGAMIRAMQKGKKTLVLTRQGRLTVWLNKLINGLMDQMVFNNLNKEPDSPLRQGPKS